MTQQQKIQLVKYRFGKHQLSAEDMLAKKVYVIRCRPSVVPVDVNIEWLMQQGWNSALDRLRYSAEQLFIRRFDPTNDFCVVVQLTVGMEMTVYGNDEEMTEMYFQNLFLGNHLDVSEAEMEIMSRDWVDRPHDLLFFCGSVHAAFGLWGNLLVEMQLNSNSAR